MILVPLPPTKPQQHFRCRSSHAAAALHLLLLGVAMASGAARAHAVNAPCCNLLQGVNLVPCLAMAAPSGGAVNISAACCASLNEALDAGRRCLCSLLLANGVLAGLVATLIPTLPMVLPLPGCYLCAPPLAACQATLLPTDYGASPASVAASVGGAAAGVAVNPPPPQAAVAPPPKNGSVAGRKDGGRTDGGAGNGSTEEQSVRRSDAFVSEGRMYMLIFAVVIAVFFFD
ncbi:non-specific lipid transfer protein GPI-anchored 11-like [Hordeum vulgare subsp. vulgare]|uniref:Bifunctional inhibitor/plant lipid transfer protein/seed storage helical domain-containing protein n=1 Tax=Hordeum vulgare subsp. vulgare TaxID=112509 RepID=A0A8I7BJH3_HORVV|nr:non-specific lipid transfer protein GPI-anchored 11-like [Hordeum vulgare subsp. vulgare]